MTLSALNSNLSNKYDYNYATQCTTLDSAYHDLMNHINEQINNLYKVEYVKEDIMKVKDFKIKNYKVCDNNGIKTVVVEFEDGSREHAVCCKEDVFELSRGIEVCVLKHIFGKEKYKEIVRESNRQIKAIDKAIKKAKKEAEESRAIIERKKAKDAKRKAKRKARERAERIADMKTAYVAALKECNMDYYRECECECGCEK